MVKLQKNCSFVFITLIFKRLLHEQTRLIVINRFYLGKSEIFELHKTELLGIVKFYFIYFKPKVATLHQQMR